MQQQKAIIATRYGRSIDILNPDVSDIHIEDIALSLSREGRYSNFTQDKYTVAQHSVLVGSMLDPTREIYGLLHDATEAYIRDVSAPVKRHLPDYQSIESNLSNAIFRAFGLNPNDPMDDVEKADQEAFRMEVHGMFQPIGEDSVWYYVPKPINSKPVFTWKDSRAFDMFLTRFYIAMNVARRGTYTT